MTEELEVYSNGLVHCSVCTNIKSTKRIVELTNIKNPTGIESQWQISTSKFHSGESNPCPCERKPNTHAHYLMKC